MPGFLLHVNGVVRCTHAATASAPPPAPPRVLVSGQPVALATDPISVAGCPFQVPVPGATKPQPCVTIRWTLPAARVKVMGVPVLLAPAPGTGAGICQSVEQIPQGPPLVGAVQARVSGT